MLTALELSDAIFIERIEAENLSAQIQGRIDGGAIPDARCFKAYGLVASSTPKRFGRKLNHTIGFGLGPNGAEAQLSAINGFYRDDESAGEIDVCPFINSSALNVLEQNGYAISINAWRRKGTMLSVVFPYFFI